MSKIQLLSHQVIHAIAAGEVIERPLMVVKELVENAIDAQATEIEVSLTNGGLSEIMVKDNGQGIPADQLPMAVSRHATSKISSLTDLEKLSSFGFRGEALASIGSVARLTILSRPASQPHAATLCMDHGQLSPVETTSGTPGTTVVVQELFSQLPARRKFLKPAKSEQAQIMKVLTALAISHPEISWRITTPHQFLAHWPATDLSQRFTQVLATSETQWVPFSHQLQFVKISGFLGKPELARATTQHQFWFINQRWVTQPTLAAQLKESFGSLLEPKKQPAALISIELPPDLIDVNVHPRKEKVALMDESLILKILDQVIKETLTEARLLYRLPESASAPNTPTITRASRQGSDLTTAWLNQLVTPWHPGRDQHHLEIGQALDTYLIVPAPTGILVIDQHAAHERIIFEQLKAAWHQTDTSSVQELDPPPLIELNPEDAIRVMEYLPMLIELGIELEPFGPQNFRLRQLPSLLADRDPAALMLEVLDDLANGQAVGTLDSITEKTMAYLACRRAVKAGDPLPLKQRQELFLQLLKTPNSSTCPHGRPTIITWEQAELEKLFKRR